MELPDNNILIAALRQDSPHHKTAKAWLENALNQGLPLRLFPTVEAGFLRLVTHPQVFAPATPMKEARRFLEILCAAPSVEIAPWSSDVRSRWLKICQQYALRGNDCNDAMLAALAIERGLRLVTFDRGFSRFTELRLLLFKAES